MFWAYGTWGTEAKGEPRCTVGGNQKGTDTRNLTVQKPRSDREDGDISQIGPVCTKDIWGHLRFIEQNDDEGYDPLESRDPCGPISSLPCTVRVIDFWPPPTEAFFA